MEVEPTNVLTQKTTVQNELPIEKVASSKVSAKKSIAQKVEVQSEECKENENAPQEETSKVEEVVQETPSKVIKKARATVQKETTNMDAPSARTRSKSKPAILFYFIQSILKRKKKHVKVN